MVVGPKSELPLQGLIADEVSWVADVPTTPFECLVQCRAQRPPAKAIVTRIGDQKFEARFLDPTVHARVQLPQASQQSATTTLAFLGEAGLFSIKRFDNV